MGRGDQRMISGGSLLARRISCIRRRTSTRYRAGSEKLGFKVLCSVEVRCLYFRELGCDGWCVCCCGVAPPKSFVSQANAVLQLAANAQLSLDAAPGAQFSLVLTETSFMCGKPSHFLIFGVYHLCNAVRLQCKRFAA